MDLFNLPAAEYKAAIYLLQRADTQAHVNAGKTELSEALKVSPAHAARILSSLIDKGIIERVRRGRYRVPETSKVESLIYETSSLTEETSSLIRGAKSTIRIDDIDVLSSIRTDNGNRDITVLTSNEVSTALRAKNQGKKKGKSVRYYDDDDVDLKAVGPAPTRDQRTPRQRRKYRAQMDHISKPRDDWNTYDAAQFFASSIERAKPQLFGRINTGRFIVVLNTWMRDHGADLALIGEAMDGFLSDRIQMDRLVRGSDPMKNFLSYLKTYRPRSSGDSEVPEWGNHEATARIFNPAILDQL